MSDRTAAAAEHSELIPWSPDWSIKTWRSRSSSRESGGSGTFEGQQVGPEHRIADGDIVELHAR